MSDMFDEMFAGGDFAPSFKFAQIGDQVAGEILSIAQQDQRDIDDPTGQTYIIDKRTGKPKKQLKVVLQTNLRNWEKVAKVPTDADTKQPLPAGQDDGRRAVYVKGWMIGAVGQAVEKATGRRGAPRVGGKLAVRYSGDRDTGKINALKLYEAMYQAPPEGFAPEQDTMFAEAAPQQPPYGGGPSQHPAPPAQQQAPQQPQQQAPQQPAQQAAPQQQDPWSAPPAPPAQGDPWANQSFGDEPPF